MLSVSSFALKESIWGLATSLTPADRKNLIEQLRGGWLNPCNYPANGLLACFRQLAGKLNHVIEFGPRALTLRERCLRGIPIFDFLQCGVDVIERFPG